LAAGTLGATIGRDLGIFLAFQGVDRFDYRREGDRNINSLEVRIGND
jgi:hypothetical protein